MVQDVVDGLEVEGFFHFGVGADQDVGNVDEEGEKLHDAPHHSRRFTHLCFKLTRITLN